MGKTSRGLIARAIHRVGPILHTHGTTRSRARHDVRLDRERTPTIIVSMKLFLTWLLGVPVLVISMVLGHTLLAQDDPRLRLQGTQCSAQRQPHNVAAPVTQQRHHIPCDMFAIQ